ncbi:MAG: hypothetical protein C0616_12295 [Desulfuromonas sp.]|nr:MAG: hypothetical protein C0616_12295 [Desulfuromonas sp.]
MNLDQALLDPTSVFEHPDEVLRQAALSRSQKLSILRRWEYDARELEVASEENMGGGPPGQLSDVLDALHQLNAGVDVASGPTTKQG